MQVSTAESMVVKLENLNRLLVVAGDVIINASNLEHAYKHMLLAREKKDQWLDEDLLTLTRELSQSASRNGVRLHHLVQAIRTVSLKDLAFRGQRTIRETARKTGKRVRFEVEGEDLSLDKTIVEALYDPVAHQLRNAVAHGIELPHERLRKNKPEEGVIRLKAYKNETDAFIQISDDGAGFDLVALRQMAIKAGFHESTQTFNADDALAFVCQPGVSTVSEVTESSGRGVGMDVVRERLETLSGSVSLETEAGQGSSFLYRIPLISAVNILDALVVQAGPHYFAFPIINVVATISVAVDQVQTNMKRGRLIKYLGTLLPVYDLHEVLDPHSGKCREASEKVNILIIENKGEQLAFDVDSFHEPQKLVTVPFNGSLFVRGLSGSTFLGGQRLGFIVDVPALLSRTFGKEESRERVPVKSVAIQDKPVASEQLHGGLTEELGEGQSLAQYVLEAEGLLVQLNETLFALEAEPSEELINRAFRFFHTIKGNLVMLHQPHCAATVHAVESVLNQVRDRRISLSEEVMDIMMDGVSFIEEALQEIKNHKWVDHPNSGILAASEKLLPKRDLGKVRDVDAEELQPSHEGAYRLAAHRRIGTPLYECQLVFDKGDEPAFLRGCLIYKRLCQVSDVIASLPPLDEMERGLMASKLRFLFVSDRQQALLAPKLEQLLRDHYGVSSFQMFRLQ